jgi:hypothetical protein
MILAPAALVVMLAIGASAQSERIIHSFTGGSDGGLPYGGVISDASGNLYGTTTAPRSRAARIAVAQFLS